MDIDEIIKKGTFPRDYRKCTTSSSLNPAIAYAMNILGGLEEKDKVLDPCCGSGTILIERQLLKPSICIGVDIDPKALDYAKQNIQALLTRHPVLVSGSIELKHGGIQEKKFPERYFTKIISNLPYGIHSGSREKNIKLYHFLAEACEKWLKKDGKAVFLTSSKKLLWNAFADKKSLKFIEEIPVKIGKLDASIFIYQKI